MSVKRDTSIITASGPLFAVVDAMYLAIQSSLVTV